MRRQPDCMEQFKISYIPGGMGLDHSAWWLCVTVLLDGIYVDLKLKYMRKADYK